MHASFGSPSLWMPLAALALALCISAAPAPIGPSFDIAAPPGSGGSFADPYVEQFLNR